MPDPTWRGKDQDKDGKRTLVGHTWVKPHERYGEGETLEFARNPEARGAIGALRRAEAR